MRAWEGQRTELWLLIWRIEVEMNEEISHDSGDISFDKIITSSEVGISIKSHLENR